MPRHPSPRQEQNRRPELPQAQGGPDHQPGRGSGRRAREEAAYSGGAGAAQRAAAAVAQQGGPPRSLRPSGNYANFAHMCLVLPKIEI